MTQSNDSPYHCIDRVFKNFVSEEYCSDLFIKKSEYLRKCLLATCDFSPKIDLVTCVCVRVY